MHTRPSDFHATRQNIRRLWLIQHTHTAEQNTRWRTHSRMPETVNTTAAR